ncbi:DNA helicase RecQ [Candidatus Uhrbacteria bacterium]|nr:DNA helicase RecQ [Candidatus Uhrbacteria bacterium]
MLDHLKTHFGFDAFRPLQEEIVTTVLARQDTLVLMPTGGGKSMCYQLPALLLDGVTLVVSPLIALMKDQVDALNGSGVPAAYLNSSLCAKDAAGVQEDALAGKVKLLYVAPERLASFSFRPFFKRLNVSLVAIDEAHCISQWGHDFRPEYGNLRDVRALFPEVPLIALTATATPQVREDIVASLGLRDVKTFVSSFNRPNLHYRVQPKYNTFAALSVLLAQHKHQSVIIYCFSRKDTEELAWDLSRAGFTALPYHAGLPREVRAHTQEQFIRDEVKIIVATIAFGMGIDKPDVRLVVHMDLPKAMESYYQETGRAGRDGLQSDCVLFYSVADRRKQEYFINQIPDEPERARARHKLRQMLEYCEGSSCRRRFVLGYFGEAYAQPSCDACDNCVKPTDSQPRDVTMTQKILSAVLRTGERFGMGYICDVLRGSRKKRVLENKHDRLSVHGLLRSVPEADLRGHISSLVRTGELEKVAGEYPTLRVSKAGRESLKQAVPPETPSV